jgi:hypothetical protein
MGDHSLRTCLQPGDVEILKGGGGKEYQSIDAPPHSEEAPGAHVGQLRWAEAGVFGLRSGEIPRLLLRYIVEPFAGRLDSTAIHVCKTFKKLEPFATL